MLKATVHITCPGFESQFEAASDYLLCHFPCLDYCPAQSLPIKAKASCSKNSSSYNSFFLFFSIVLDNEPHNQSYLYVVSPLICRWKTASENIDYFCKTEDKMYSNMRTDRYICMKCNNDGIFCWKSRNRKTNHMQIGTHMSKQAHHPSLQPY